MFAQIHLLGNDAACSSNTCVLLHRRAVTILLILFFTLAFFHSIYFFFFIFTLEPELVTPVCGGFTKNICRGLNTNWASKQSGCQFHCLHCVWCTVRCHNYAEIKRLLWLPETYGWLVRTVSCVCWLSNGSVTIEALHNKYGINTLVLVKSVPQIGRHRKEMPSCLSVLIPWMIQPPL